MFCVLSLIVFSIMGLFSATHRQLAKEALACVFRRITIRPCNTVFDKKIKAKILGKLLNKHPKLAKNINRFWEVISWFLVIIFFLSLFFSTQTLYNLARYNTCNPQNPSSCVLTN